jgi:hypothetical protein
MAHRIVAPGRVGPVEVLRQPIRPRQIAHRVAQGREEGAARRELVIPALRILVAEGDENGSVRQRRAQDVGDIERGVGRERSDDAGGRRGAQRLRGNLDEPMRQKIAGDDNEVGRSRAS